MSAPQVSSYASWRYFFLWAHISGGMGLRSPRLRSALMLWSRRASDFSLQGTVFNLGQELRMYARLQLMLWLGAAGLFVVACVMLFHGHAFRKILDRQS